MRTRALLLDRDLALGVGERELPEPTDGELLVRVEWAGVCESDLHVLRTGDGVSYWPATLGHEVVGIVAGCPGGEVSLGTRVVIDSSVPCGSCGGCAGGPHRRGSLGWVGHAQPGGFEEYLVISAGRVVACPSELEAAVAVLAEPLAVAMHAVRMLAHRPGRVRILGYDPTAALIHLEVTRRWPEVAVSVVEPVPGRRQLAEAHGAEATAECCAVASPASLVVDTAGYPASRLDASGGYAPGGEMLVIAGGHEPARVAPTEVVERETALVGCHGFAEDLAGAVSLLARDAHRFRSVITDAVLLEEAPDRLRELVVAPSAGKVVIRPWES